ANRLATQLERDGIEANAIHGNKSQNARTRALKSFKDGELRVLVATDIAARGLDIEALPHVVNYDLPHVAEDYLHRIGRTGRAGASGEAVSLISPEERPLLAAIERLMNRRVELRVIGGFEGAGTPERELPHRAPHAHQRPQQHARPQAQPQRHQRPPQQAQRRNVRAEVQPPQHAVAQAELQPVPPQPVPGYRPLTAHAPQHRVPSLLGGRPQRRR
ncbi:MAG: RNA helicase, partial [Betaproteobacteria bacterium]